MQKILHPHHPEVIGFRFAELLASSRTALKRATSSEKGFTASGASLGLMPMRIARPGTMSGRPQRQNSGSSTSTLTLSPADGGGATIGSGTALGSTGSNSSAGGTLGPSSGTSSSANVSDSQPQVSVKPVNERWAGFLVGRAYGRSVGLGVLCALCGDYHTVKLYATNTGGIERSYIQSAPTYPGLLKEL